MLKCNNEMLFENDYGKTLVLSRRPYTECVALVKNMALRGWMLVRSIRTTSEGDRYDNTGTIIRMVELSMEDSSRD